MTGCNTREENAADMAREEAEKAEDDELCAQLMADDAAYDALADRAYLAAQFAKGELTKDEAYRLLLMAESFARSYPIASMCAEDVLEQLLEKYQDHPLLEELADGAAAQVSQQSEGMDLSWEYERAIELVEEEAAKRGVTLVKKEDDDAEQR